jgi:hypothetical protein
MAAAGSMTKRGAGEEVVSPWERSRLENQWGGLTPATWLETYPLAAEKR